MSIRRYLSFESLLFYGLLVACLVNVWSVKVYCTIDGPSHLYNAGLMNLIPSDPFLREYYALNPFYQSNYFSHVVLSKLFLVFDPFTSEKILISFMVVLLPLTFRKALQVYTQSTRYSFLIFPLVFSFLFHMGFFNFCMAFVFFNAQLILLHAVLQSSRKWYHPVLFVLSGLLLFYCHAFVYVITLLVLAAVTVVYLRFNWGEILRRGFFVILLLLPSALLFAVFYFKSSIPNYDYPASRYSHLSDMTTFSSAMAYNKDTDGVSATALFLLFIFLASIISAKRFLGESKKEFIYADVFLVLALLIVPINMYANGGWLTGMLTQRLSYLFFYFLVFWIALNNPLYKKTWFVAAALVAYTFLNLSSHRHDIQKILSTKALDIAGASGHIEAHSIIYPVDFTESWLEPHFANYLGIGKSVVNYENYEAYLDWFPTEWKEDKKAALINRNGGRPFPPDYVVLYGDQSKINLDNNAELKRFIDSNTVKTYESADNYCRLFKVIKK